MSVGYKDPMKADYEKSNGMNPVVDISAWALRLVTVWCVKIPG